MKPSAFADLSGTRAARHRTQSAFFAGSVFTSGFGGSAAGLPSVLLPESDFPAASDFFSPPESFFASALPSCFDSPLPPPSLSFFAASLYLGGAIIGFVKPAPLEQDSGPAADLPPHALLTAIRADFDRFGLDRLELFELVLAGVADVFVGGHGRLICCFVDVLIGGPPADSKVAKK